MKSKDNQSSDQYNKTCAVCGKGHPKNELIQCDINHSLHTRNDTCEKFRLLK